MDRRSGRKMGVPPWALALVAGLVCGGCMSQAQLLASMQPMAMQTAVDRGKFDLGCPQATPTVLSKELVQPVLSGAWGVGGVERAEYTIGVSGCDKRHTYVVICPEGGDGCFAAGPGEFTKD